MMRKCIVFDKENQCFELYTRNTCYVLGVYGGQHLVHYYYGDKKNKSNRYIHNYRSFSPYPEDLGTSYSADVDLCEIPFFGSGDFRVTALKIRNENGDCCTLFRYKEYEIFQGRKNLTNLPYCLPYAEADDETQTLKIIMEDSVSHCTLELYYTIFYDCDVISRYHTVTYHGTEQVKIEKSMSLTLDIPAGKPLDKLTLEGSYGIERYYPQRIPIVLGCQSIFSNRGVSSPHHNPFLAVCDSRATEQKGEVYGFNFNYSGSFLDEIELDQNRMTRIQIGLGQDNFGWLLKPGESFTTPEAVMTYTKKGIGQMSRNFHDFIRGHILPKKSLTEKRPVVLNTWEASYFDIDQEKLLVFAEQAHRVGIDMLVMDDGWFGKRNDDRAGLGDWFENKEKFPDGLASFVQKVKQKGVKFGIWIEPEMVNPDSDLYRSHPEWCCAAKGRTPNLSRNQLVLDMANPEVLDHLKTTFSKTFKNVGIDYIKWDMNRHLSDVASSYLPKERQDETWFRYMTGVYELYEWFLETFPGLMIENCSGGGGRYDLGMMKYSYQIWASDCTVPAGRIGIQAGSAVAYPPCMCSCHVSNAENLTQDPQYLDFAYKTALGGVLGYELHLPNMPDWVKTTIQEQVREYHEHYEHVIKTGDYYKLIDPISPVFTPYYANNYYRLYGKHALISAYYFLAKDGSQILLSFLQAEADPQPQTVTLRIAAADKNAEYVDRLTGKSYSGEQLRKGIQVQTSTSPHYAVLMDFRKK